jgi:hypothetical protein
MGRRLMVGALAATLTACAAQTSMDVQSGRNPAADFSRYATYAWKTAGVPPPQWPAEDARAAFDWRLRTLVDQELAERGYQLVGNDGADLLIAYHVDRRHENMADTMQDYARYRAQGGEGDPGEAWVQGYEEVTLVVDATDPRTRLLVWYGSASAVANPKLRAERLPIAVERIFAQFPARGTR